MSNLLPIGSYRAIAVDQQLTEAKNGTPQIHVVFKFLDQPDGWVGEVHRSWWGTLNGGKAEDIALKGLRNAGWQGTDITDLSTVGSSECRVVVVHDTGNDGVTRAQIAWVNSLNGGAGINPEKQLAPAKMADLRARIAARAAAKLQGAPAAAAAPPPMKATGTDGIPYQPTGDDDDIPF